MKRLSVGIIGGGLGGLAAAIQLAVRGYDVTLYEKNRTVGGKLAARSLNGIYFDLGPTVLTMPFVLEELFAVAGKRLSDYLTLLPVEPTCRYHWSDGSHFDAYHDRALLLAEAERLFPYDVSAFEQYLDDIRELYEATRDVFLFRPFRGLREFFSLENMKLAPMLRRLGLTSTLDHSLRSRFRDARLIQMLDRFATYNGSSPYTAPATLNVIAHVELGMGTFYPEGGMVQIARQIESLAEECGVTIVREAEVKGLRRSGRNITGITIGSDTYDVDIVISNVDAAWTWKNLLEPAGFGVPARILRSERSCSGFLVTAVVEAEPTDGNRSELPHHEIFFADDYSTEFSQIFQQDLPPDPMTIYRSISGRSNPDLVARGVENWYLLINVPSSNRLFRNDREKLEYARRIFSRLRDFGVNVGMEGDGGSSVADERVRKIVDLEFQVPHDIEVRDNSPGGAIYGTSSNSILSAFLRPRNCVASIRNLYMVGGSVHPGGGIPLALLSGKITAELIDRKSLSH